MAEPSPCESTVLGGGSREFVRDRCLQAGFVADFWFRSAYFEFLHFWGPLWEANCRGRLLTNRFTFWHFSSLWGVSLGSQLSRMIAYEPVHFLALFINLGGHFGDPIVEEGCLRTGSLFGTFHDFGGSLWGANCRGWLLTNRSNFWHFSSLWGISLGSQLSRMAARATAPPDTKHDSSLGALNLEGHRTPQILSMTRVWVL